MKISRRKFVETSALGCATALLPHVSFSATEKVPMRQFGSTGERVSILAFGGGNRYSMYQSDEQAFEVLNHAIDLGINYIDTAHEYGQNGESEIRIGKVLKTRRKEVLLATKFYDRKYDDAMRSIETSLKRLQTDHLDVLNIHGLSTPEELATIEAPDGALKAIYQARDQKMARFIGITCHNNPQNLATALERHDLNVVQMALNAGALGMQFDPAPAKAVPLPQGSFEKVALPVATRKKMAIIAMKIFGQDFLQNKAPAEKLIHYSLSLPVSTAIIGMPKPEYLEQNVAFARNFQPLPADEMRRISESIGHEHKAAMEHFLHTHIDA